MGWGAGGSVALPKRHLSALTLRACTSRAPAEAHLRTVRITSRVSDISLISPSRGRHEIPIDQQAPSKARVQDIEAVVGDGRVL